jgi:hypothetical protein
MRMTASRFDEDGSRPAHENRPQRRSEALEPRAQPERRNGDVILTDTPI